MKIEPLLTDAAILGEIGKRLAARRLDLELTQAEVAEEAGIAKRTLERIEAGHSSQLSSVIRVLRVLDEFSGLENLVRPATPGPIALWEMQRRGKARQRAPRRSARKSKPARKPWTWGDNQ